MILVEVISSNMEIGRTGGNARYELVYGIMLDKITFV